MVKRIFDIYFAFVGLFTLSPLFLIVVLMIRLDSKGPILFRQERVGHHFKPFYIYKFRTMTVQEAGATLKLATSRDSRITRVGSFLRKSKMDEIPQLINVLKGEMSFVGPRPELKVFADQYPEDFKEILKVVPGITDLASLEYKDEEKIHNNSKNPEEVYVNKILPKKIPLAKEYVRRASFWLDLKIVFKTIWRIL
jgi:lipopolysaccharide/colanic/teichoic acid biosynthesis glycosyltransferase